MKITKSELKDMIREALREELNNRPKLKESHYPDREDWFCDKCEKKMDYDHMIPVTVDEEELLVCDKCYKQMLDAGIIEPSEGFWIN